MSLIFINPESLGAPRGYANGVLAPPGNGLLFIAGQVGWDKEQKIISSEFVEQFERALANVLAVATEAGGAPERIVRLAIYVTDIEAYRSRTKEIGKRYRSLMGRHFPAMVLVEVKSLLDPDALVEIEGMAVL